MRGRALCTGFQRKPLVAIGAFDESRLTDDQEHPRMAGSPATPVTAHLRNLDFDGFWRVHMGDSPCFLNFIHGLRN